MAMLSLREAAQLCGRGKSTIQAAIKDGKLSAGRNEKGGYEIDPSELHRVFPFNMSGNGKQNGDNPAEPDAAGLQALSHAGVSGIVRKSMNGTGQDVSDAELRVKHLEELLAAERAGREDLKEALQARVEDLQTTVADLRKRLDQAEEEKMRLLPAPDAKAQEENQRLRGFWSRLTGR